MIRVVCICVISAATAAAQDASAPPSLAALQKTAEQKTAEWNRLAANLEASILPLLPCDPKVPAAILQVNRASDARVTAVAAYMEAASRDALLQAEAAKRVLASAQSLGGDLAAEKSDMAVERAGVDGQIANLAQSGQRRASAGSPLTAPQDALIQISSVEELRSATLDSATSHIDPALAAVRDLAAQLEAREVAWKDVQTAFEMERARWNAYYTARLARSQAECTVTKGPASATPRAQGKQK
jgi:hypothetical protein